MVAIRGNNYSGYNHPPNYRELNYGSRGNTVRGIQRSLRAHGYRVAEDGLYGNATKNAVRDFQRRNGLAADGIVGPETGRALQGTMPSVGSRYSGGYGPPSVLRANNQVSEANRNLQRMLNAMGYRVHVDGRFGHATENALKAFQRERGIRADGVFGRETLNAMRMATGGASADSFERNTRAGNPLRTDNVQPRNPRGGPPNRTAAVESYRFRGQRHQMALGKITINGNVYQFRSGGGGRGNLPPGDYKITPHLWSRRDKPTMMVDGVGYSFAMSNKYDARVNGTRTLLRIHPDGGGAGTIGCIGIVGNGNVQRDFVRDMRAELARNGGSFTLSVRP